MNKNANILDALRGAKNLTKTTFNLGRSVSNLPKETSKWNIIKNFKSGLNELKGLDKADKKTKAKTIYNLIENYGKTQKPIKNGLAKGLALGAGGTAVAGYGLHKLTNKKHKKEAGFFSKKIVDALTPEQMAKLQKKVSFRNGLMLGTGGTIGIAGGGYALKQYLDKNKQEQFLNNNNQI